MTSTAERLQNVFRDVFEDDSLLIRDDMTSADVDGWDSLAHINLIIETEKAFKIRFATAEISRLKEPGQNVGSFIRLIEGKLGAV